jgi:protein phosphatase
MTVSLTVAALTDPGVQRENNEDYYYTVTQDTLAPELAAQKGYLYFVADGVGGHQGGEVASQMTAQIVSQYYYQDPNPDVGASLQNAVAEANRQIYHQGISTPEQYGMGTTFSGVVIRGDQAFVANVGDSRTYLIRGGQIQQLSTDHTWVQDRVRAGVLTPQEAAKHPQKNVITRSLGGELQVNVDVFPFQPVAQGDVFLMCSDGLTDLVSDQEIAAVVTQNRDLDQAARQLVDMAKQRGAPDNVTVVIVCVGRHRAVAGARRPEGMPAGGRKLPILPILGGLVAIAAVVALVFVLTGQPSSGGHSGAATPMPKQTAEPAVGDVATQTSPLTQTQGVTPTLTAPQPEQSFATNESVPFTWEGVQTGDAYRFQLEIQDPDGAPVTLANRTTQRNTLSVPLDANWSTGHYTWYVVTQRWDGEDWREVARSGSGSFQVNVNQGPPASGGGEAAVAPSDCVPQPPTLVAPVHESTQSSGVVITFQWQGGERCGHLWRVQFVGQFMDCGPTDTNAAVCTIPDLAQGQQYTWRVVLVDAQGQVVSGGTSAERTMWLQALGSDKGAGSTPGGNDGGGGGDNCHTETYECNCTIDPVTQERTCETCTREVCD